MLYKLVAELLSFHFQMCIQIMWEGRRREITIILEQNCPSPQRQNYLMNGHELGWMTWKSLKEETRDRITILSKGIVKSSSESDEKIMEIFEMLRKSQQIDFHSEIRNWIHPDEFIVNGMKVAREADVLLPEINHCLCFRKC